MLASWRRITQVTKRREGQGSCQPPQELAGSAESTNDPAASAEPSPALGSAEPADEDELQRCSLCFGHITDSESSRMSCGCNPLAGAVLRLQCSHSFHADCFAKLVGSSARTTKERVEAELLAREAEMGLSPETSSRLLGDRSLATLREAGSLRQCPQCGYGPVLNRECNDMAAHHRDPGERPASADLEDLRDDTVIIAREQLRRRRRSAMLAFEREDILDVEMAAPWQQEQLSPHLRDDLRSEATSPRDMDMLERARGRGRRHEPDSDFDDLASEEEDADLHALRREHARHLDPVMPLGYPSTPRHATMVQQRARLYLDPVVPPRVQRVTFVQPEPRRGRLQNFFRRIFRRRQVGQRATATEPADGIVIVMNRPGRRAFRNIRRNHRRAQNWPDPNLRDLLDELQLFDFDLDALQTQSNRCGKCGFYSAHWEDWHRWMGDFLAAVLCPLCKEKVELSTDEKARLKLLLDKMMPPGLPDRVMPALVAKVSGILQQLSHHHQLHQRDHRARDDFSALLQLSAAQAKQLLEPLVTSLLSAGASDHRSQIDALQEALAEVRSLQNCSAAVELPEAEFDSFAAARASLESRLQELSGARSGADNLLGIGSISAASALKLAMEVEERIREACASFTGGDDHSMSPHDQWRYLKALVDGRMEFGPAEDGPLLQSTLPIEEDDDDDVCGVCINTRLERALKDVAALWAEVEGAV
mmetsp:Transcript_35749/g.83723  ORF Transcript_35749/g.83723 Transcript_35749/m.83723 type:complete len:707 (-) Transcript_35749:87-2207(-)